MRAHSDTSPVVTRKLRGIYRRDAPSSHRSCTIVPCLTTSRSGAAARSTCRVTRRPGSHTPELWKPAAAPVRSDGTRSARGCGCGNCYLSRGSRTPPDSRLAGRFRVLRRPEELAGCAMRVKTMVASMYDRVSLVALNLEPDPGTMAETPSPARLPDLIDSQVSWRLQRAGGSAQCLLYSAGPRVELHITMTYHVVMSQPCTGPQEASAISNAWWSALVDRGWVEHESRVTLRPKRDRRSSTVCANGLFACRNAAGSNRGRTHESWI